MLRPYRGERPVRAFHLVHWVPSSARSNPPPPTVSTTCVALLAFLSGNATTTNTSFVMKKICAASVSTFRPIPCVGNWIEKTLLDAAKTNLIAGWRHCPRREVGLRNDGRIYHVDVRCRGVRLGIRHCRGAACCAPTTKRGAGGMSFTASLSDIVNRNDNALLGKHKSWGRVPLGDTATILNGFAFPSSR